MIKIIILPHIPVHVLALCYRSCSQRGPNWRPTGLFEQQDTFNKLTASCSAGQQRAPLIGPLGMLTSFRIVSTPPTVPTPTARRMCTKDPLFTACVSQSHFLCCQYSSVFWSFQDFPEFFYLQASAVSQSILDGIAYVSSSSLAGESGDVSSLDASLPSLLPSSTTGDPADGIVLQPQASGATTSVTMTLVVDSMNDNPVMVGLLRLLDAMHAKFGSSWGPDWASVDEDGNPIVQPCAAPMPAWMESLITTLRAPETPAHARLFIVKVGLVLIRRFTLLCILRLFYLIRFHFLYFPQYFSKSVLNCTIPFLLHRSYVLSDFAMPESPVCIFPIIVALPLHLLICDCLGCSDCTSTHTHVRSLGSSVVVVSVISYTRAVG